MSSTEHLFSSEPIIGYRCFRYDSAADTGTLFDLCAVAPEGVNPFEWARRKRLMSAAMHAVWPEYQPMTARCEGDGFGQSYAHEGVAVKNCHCGLWAVKTIEQAITYADNYGTRVVAEVALWGRFVEHELGWRAEHGYPQKLWVLKPHSLGSKTLGDYYPVFAAKLGEQYGVPADVIELPAPKRKSNLTHAFSHKGAVPTTPAAMWTFTTAHTYPMFGWDPSAPPKGDEDEVEELPFP